VSEPTVRWVQFRSFSGPSISDGVRIPTPHNGHVGRAYWLTTKVETGGYFGRVMAYDGTCMTAGPDQHIAVFPRELVEEDWRAEDDQGSLWALLGHLRLLRGSDDSFDEALGALESELASDGFMFDRGGFLAYAKDRAVSVGKKVIQVKAGDRAHGAVIRETYTAPMGQVPKSGASWEKARRWALLWHYVTVHPVGWKTQLDFGMGHLIERVRRRRIGDLGTADTLVYGREGISSPRTNSIPSELDLAMCVYHANSVNGPTPASAALGEAARAHHPSSNPAGFARLLIQKLGNNPFGRWDDDIRTGRYQRTRDHAMASGLWPRSLFEGASAIMPADLPG
jgi:hypothetical protein